MSAPAPLPGHASSAASPASKRWWLWVLLLLVAAALIAAAWMLMKPDARRSAAGQVSSAPPVGLKPPGAAGAEGGAASAAHSGLPAATSATPGLGTAPAAVGAPGTARYPIDRVLGAEAPIDPATASLDPGTSDKAILGALSGLPGQDQLMRLILPSDIVRRLVLTIDNLPGESMSMQYRAVVATPGSFMVEKRQSETAIAPRNASRYDAFITFASSADS
ncbi:MAG: DUF3014 domain-containing protein, partial [Betaproteobacteria bacterium]|nr:DUF3014 domain-containing protein [Betaproteobacteria bacterium]